MSFHLAATCGCGRSLSDAEHLGWQELSGGIEARLVNCCACHSTRCRTIRPKPKGEVMVTKDELVTVADAAREFAMNLEKFLDVSQRARYVSEAGRRAVVENAREIALALELMRDSMGGA